MAKIYTHYSILVSCPSDMNRDRQSVQKAVCLVNENNACFRNVFFDVKYWSKDVLFRPGDPQLTINNDLVNTSDLIIALFGTKLGSPTERYASGTIEEIEEMIKAGKQVFVCFSERDINISGGDSTEILQGIIKVREFKRNYRGLYITYKNEQELIEQLSNQLRLYLSTFGTFEDPYICHVPFTFQELRGNRKGIDTAKELVFIARTGKIFIGKYYNHIYKMVESGGSFTYVTSENFNVIGDISEYNDNQNYSLTTLLRLQRKFPLQVKIRVLPVPVNRTMYYMRENNGNELINVKFNFQSHYKGNHPLFDLYSSNPLFSVFFQEINRLVELSVPLV